MTITTCACGFANSPNAKFCGGCGTPLSVAVGRCAICGHTSPATARFCENCAAPLTTSGPQVDNGGIVGPPPPPPPPPDGRREGGKGEADLTRRVGRVHLKGVVVSLQGVTMRMITPQHSDQPIEIRFTLRAAKTLKGTLQPGDEIDVRGKWKDGLVIPREMINVRTGVRVLRHTGALGNVFIVLGTTVLGILVSILGVTPVPVIAGVLAGLLIVLVRGIAAGYREKRGVL